MAQHARVNQAVLFGLASSFVLVFLFALASSGAGTGMWITFSIVLVLVLLGLRAILSPHSDPADTGIALNVAAVFATLFLAVLAAIAGGRSRRR